MIILELSICDFLVHTYEVEVHTGDVNLAGTDASVYVNLSGVMGSTGKRQLKENKRDSNKFEQGSVDMFEIKALH